MIYGAILAGGTGSRMKLSKMPKQFIEIRDIPIIILTIKRMLEVEPFDCLYIAIHPEWEGYLKDVLYSYNVNTDKIKIVHGAKDRIGSIENVINDIFESSQVGDNDIIIIHDAVRPFASEELFLRCIEASKKHDAVVATVPAIDTMVFAKDNEVTSIPDRSEIFNGQAPEGFKLRLFRDTLESLNDVERSIITGTVQICYAKGIKVNTVEGDYQNIKITTNEDLMLADLLVEKVYKVESMCIGSRWEACL
ncbi:MAG: 2-C-methyl-D-erythritol 4-phosphate cytidylyltransferase [Lactobacillus sp.]|jgi:2-C-methyl-D-erythritol 4-phosphate cytidylyltransferase|nr:2-C-methyl-D-erythritol 4-phosphate cytidylyltransferase [Lactobacillus sp.]